MSGRAVRFDGVRKFSVCPQCEEPVEVGRDLAYTEHGEHSCDCKWCSGLCPGAGQPSDEIVEATFDEVQRARRSARYRKEKFGA